MGFSTVTKLAASTVITGIRSVGGMRTTSVLGVGSRDQSGEPAVTIDTTLMESPLVDTNELVAKSYSLTQVGKYLEQGTKAFSMEVPDTNAHYLITCSGGMRAGVADISRTQVEMDETGHVVAMTVSIVEVLSASIGPASAGAYDQSFFVVNQVEVGKVTVFLADRETAAADEAISKGLLDKV